MIIVDPPRFDSRFRIREREELLDAQALVALLNDSMRILHRLAGADEVELDHAPVGPVLERATY